MTVILSEAARLGAAESKDPYTLELALSARVLY